MRRRYSQTSPEYVPRGMGGQLGRMILLLIAVGFAFAWSRDPRNWQWINALAPSAPNDQPSEKPPVVPPSLAAIVPGPNDKDAAEMEEAKKQFEAIDDGRKLADVEMPAYWRLMRWARSEKFADLEKRAIDNVRYAQLWDSPGNYRGKLVRLKVHIRRVVTWAAPQNSADVKQVYEAWGWTDDSKSLPLVFVLGELPPGLQVGDSVFADGVFVGYFLKMLWYVNAEGKQQTAPLLIGQMAKVDSPQETPIATSSWRSAVPFLWILVAIFIGGTIEFFRRRQKRRPKLSPTESAEAEEWLREQSEG